MSYFHSGRLFTDDGSLNTIFRGSIVSRTQMAGGIASDAFGNVYIEHDSPGALTRHNGICTTGDGALFVTTDAPTTGNYRHNGIRFRADGAMHVTSGGLAAGDTMHQGWRISAAGQAYVTAGFQAKFADLGSGAVDTTTIFSVGSGTPTFTRATAAASKLSTGLWKLDVASGTARSHYLGLDTTVGAYGGYLVEGARTNSCLQSRDITNASWTKVTLTTAKTSTGIDGVGSSCTRCTAAGANSTALQAITLASAAKTFSVWIKRVTGTGQVFITLDNDATRTDVTALINSSTFMLVQMTQTLANPTVGFKIATSGDAIDVDVAQLEDGASFASTPIPTTTVAVTRNADVLTYLSAGNVSDAAGSTYAEIASFGNLFTASAAIVSSFNGGTSSFSQTNSATSINIADGTTTVALTVTSLVNRSAKVASSWGVLKMSVSEGGLISTSAAYDGSFSSTSIGIGQHGGGGANALHGTFKNVRIWQRQLPDTTLQVLTA